MFGNKKLYGKSSLQECLKSWTQKQKYFPGNSFPEIIYLTNQGKIKKMNL